MRTSRNAMGIGTHLAGPMAARQEQRGGAPKSAAPRETYFEPIVNVVAADEPVQRVLSPAAGDQAAVIGYLPFFWVSFSATDALPFASVTADADCVPRLNTTVLPASARPSASVSVAPRFTLLFGPPMSAPL